MNRDDDTPQFMLRIHSPACNCFANCWPCSNHDFLANRAGRILVSCTCTNIITAICGSNISFTPRNTPWERFNGPFRVYRLITAHCPNVLQLETCRTFREIQTVGRRWVLDCGCLVSLICCEDPSPDGQLAFADGFLNMNDAFLGLGGLGAQVPPVGGSANGGRTNLDGTLQHPTMGRSANGGLNHGGRTLQGSAQYQPLRRGGNVNSFAQRSSGQSARANNNTQGSSGQTARGETVNRPGRSADQPIELESDDENIEDAPPTRTANQ